MLGSQPERSQLYAELITNGSSVVRIQLSMSSHVGCAGYQRLPRGEDSVVHVESWTAHYEHPLISQLQTF